MGRSKATKPVDAADGTSRRQARLAARAAEAKAAAKRRVLVRTALALAVIAGLALGAAALYGRLTEQVTWQTFADQGNRHLADTSTPYGDYNSDPPTSGPHAPQRPVWGVHVRAIPKPLQVHGLEDGGVLVQYNCPTGCPDFVARLEAIVRRYQDHVILAPHTGMRARIALTAWTRLDAFEEYDEARIVRFIERFKGIDHHK